MKLPVIQIVMMSIGCLVLLVWLIIYFKSLKYTSLFDSLEEKDFPLKELYCFGYCMLEMTHYTYKNKNDRKMRERLEILYDPQYADYYLRVNYAQKLTITALVIVVAFIMYGFADDIAFLALVLGLAALVYYYFGQLIDEQINKRSDSLINDFTEVVSKLALLTNAGMILREAWEKIAFTGDTVLYVEMQKTMDDMKNGISDAEAIRRFGIRCMMPEVKKFSATIIQGIEKGNRELSIMLERQSEEVWNMKKHLAKRKGEKAASKLIIPMMIMFLGILIMIVVPIFANLGV